MLAPNEATPVRRAIYAMWPSLDPNAPGRFLGRHEAIRQLLGGRTSVATIRGWMAGKRRAPQWAKRIIEHELKMRAAELFDIAAAIEAEQNLGSGHALRRYWQKKKAAANERP
jgi:hypothetical protein